jgi:CDP-2,3-bis-(O-geranylgeranyl)-sn-glycerol synthase
MGEAVPGREPRAERFRWSTVHAQLIAQLLILLALANGTPVIAKKLLGDRLACPLDGGALFFDDQRIFGKSKTVRGIVLSVAATTCLAPLVGASYGMGALVAAMAMLGDLLSSFAKRRLGFRESSQAIGLDQVPESLLPATACLWIAPLSVLDAGLVTIFFFLGELAFSRVLYRLKIRDRPY